MMAERHINIFYRQTLRPINGAPILSARLCVIDIGIDDVRWFEAGTVSRDTFATAGHPKVAVDLAIDYAVQTRVLAAITNDKRWSKRLENDIAYLRDIASYTGRVEYSESQETYVADHNDGADELGVPDTRVRMNECATAAQGEGVTQE